MQTLLESFLGKKLNSYREPTREGTGKGERVGFSKKKYHAALLALTSDSVVDQANTVGGRYPVVLNWRSQPEFKEAVAQLVEEFSDKVLELIREKNCDQRFVASDKSLSDLMRYGDDLLSAISKKSLPKDLKDESESRLFYAVRALLDRAAGSTNIQNKDLEQAWKGLDADQRKKIAKDYLDTIGKVLAKSAPTYLERRKARLLAEMVGKLIG